MATDTNRSSDGNERTEKKTQMTKFKCAACNRYLDYSFYVLGNPSNVSINLSMKTENCKTQTGGSETNN